MQPPIFVWEPNDLSAFATVEAVERFIEPYDVAVYEVYDSVGRKCRLTEQKGRVVLEEAEESPTHHDRLRNLLITALGASGVEASGDESLERLVKRAAVHFDTASPPSLGQLVMRGLRALPNRLRR